MSIHFKNEVKLNKIYRHQGIDVENSFIMMSRCVSQNIFSLPSTSRARHGAPLPGPVGGRSPPASAGRTWVEALSSALDLEPQ